MKMKKLSKKLELNKTTITNLNQEQLSWIKGGTYTPASDYCIPGTGITCHICDTDISCVERKCDW